MSLVLYVGMLSRTALLSCNTNVQYLCLSGMVGRTGVQAHEQNLAHNGGLDPIRPLSYRGSICRALGRKPDVSVGGYSSERDVVQSHALGHEVALMHVEDACRRVEASP